MEVTQAPENDSHEGGFRAQREARQGDAFDRNRLLRGFGQARRRIAKTIDDKADDRRRLVRNGQKSDAAHFKTSFEGRDGASQQAPAPSLDADAVVANQAGEAVPLRGLGEQ